MAEDRLLTPEQVAARLAISRLTVMKWLREGKIPGQKLGRKTWGSIPTTSTPSYIAELNRLRSHFDWLNPELDPGICDKLPLMQGYSAETVLARWHGA